MSDFISTPTIARLLDCHPMTIRNLIARGELRAIRVGRQWRVSRESLTEFIEQQIRQMEKQRRSDDADRLAEWLTSTSVAG